MLTAARARLTALRAFLPMCVSAGLLINRGHDGPEGKGLTDRGQGEGAHVPLKLDVFLQFLPWDPPQPFT
jgi:hypothetical protein